VVFICAWDLSEVNKKCIGLFDIFFNICIHRSNAAVVGIYHLLESLRHIVPRFVWVGFEWGLGDEMGEVGSDGSDKAGHNAFGIHLISCMD
jgi:hypothetical protein